jgi:hypothetical protein
MTLLGDPLARITSEVFKVSGKSFSMCPTKHIGAIKCPQRLGKITQCLPQ